MGRIDIILPDDLEDKLKMEAGKRLGAKRGAFTEAIKDAIGLWLDPKTIEIMEKYSGKSLDSETREILKKYRESKYE
ncbi:MAG: hypothetical protein HY295_01045 [Thaumarchaeota archaeon]|nr:hypothetical protein [Nitrososphaerota archaeon]